MAKLSSKENIKKKKKRIGNKEKNVQNRYVRILSPEFRGITLSTRHDYQPFDLDICQSFIYVSTFSVFIFFNSVFLILLCMYA